MNLMVIQLGQQIGNVNYSFHFSFVQRKGRLDFYWNEKDHRTVRNLTNRLHDGLHVMEFSLLCRGNDSANSKQSEG